MRTVAAALALAVAAGAVPLAAQQDKDAVLAVVKKVLDGMRTRDTALMRAQFAPGAHLVGIDSKSGKPEVKTIDPGDWIGAVGKGTGPAWDERIFDPVVAQDDNIAHVWAYYEFWRGPKLSHCGYDSFFLVKLGEGWKLSQVADTRRTDCKPR
jgi:hypothetical protein